MAKTKRAKKPKAAAGDAKQSAPKMPAGANRRAVAQLTIRLAKDVKRIRDEKAELAKEEAALFNTYKKDTGRSKSATKRALAFYLMEDSVARQTEVSDQIDVMADLGMAVDLPLFHAASGEAGVAADMEREVANPGFIAGLGAKARRDGVGLDECPYPESAESARKRWTDGWQDEQNRQEHEAEDAEAAAKAKADEPTGATKH